MLTHGVVEDENGRYEGELKKGKRHGQGTYIYTKNGHSYIGHWSNNVRDGAGSMHFRNGDVLTCRWSHDQYVESQRAAVMKYKAKDETYIGAMTCTHLRHGQGELTNGDGSYYKGEWKWDERHGRGLQRYVSGDTYEGSWRDGRRHGTGVYTWNNSNNTSSGGATWRGSWNQDKPTGQGMFTLQGHQRKGEFDQHVTLLSDLSREVATSGPIVSDSPTQHMQKSKSRQSLGIPTSTSTSTSRKKKTKKQLRASAGSATERKWEEEEEGNNNEDEKTEEETSGSGLLGGLKRILFSKKAHTLDGAISPRTIASYTNSTQQTSSSQLISSASTSPTATIKTLQTTSSPAATTTTSKVPPLPLRHVPEDSQQTTIEHDDYDYIDPISITETHVAPASTSITPAMYQSRTRSQRKKHGERPSMSRSITQKKESITQTATVASAPISSSSSLHASPSTETRELTSPTSSISSPTAAQVNFVQLAVRHPQQQLKRTTSSFLPSRSKKFATVPSSVLSDALASPTLSDVLIPTNAPSANFKAITEEKEHNTTNPSHTRQCSVGANLSKHVHDDEKQPPSPIPSQSEIKKHSATPIRYESDRLRHARAAAEQAAHEERLKEMHIIKSIFSILKKEEIEERIAEKEKKSNEKKSRSHDKKSRSSGIKHSPSISANSTGSNISVAMANPDDREEDVINKIATEEQRQHRMLDEIEALSPATKKEYLRAKRRQTEQAWTQHALDEFIRDQGLDKQISPKRRLQISPTHRQTSPMNRHSPARQRKSSPSPHRKSHPSPHHLKTPTIRKAPSHFRFSPPATAQRHLHSPSITSTLYIHDDTDEMDSYILSEDIESFLDANKPATPQGLIPPKRATLTGKGNKRSSTTSPSAQGGGGGGGGALPMTALAHLISAQKSPPRRTPSPTSLAPSHSTFPSAKLSSIDDDHPYSTKSFSAVDGMDTGTDIETEDEFDAAIAEEEALQAEMDREEQQKMDDALRQEDKAYQRRAAMETERKRREQEMKDTKLRGSKMNLFKCVAEEAVRRVREKELQKMGKVHHRTESTAQKTAALVEMAQMAMVLYRQAQDATVPQKMISAMKQNKENSTRSPPITTTTLTVTASPTARPKLSVNNLESPKRSASFSFSPTSLAQKMKQQQQMASQMGPTTTKQAKQSVSKTHIQIKKRSPAITAVPGSPARCGTTEVETAARRSIITSVR